MSRRSSQPRDPIHAIDSNSPSNKVARARKSTASVSSSSTSDRISSISQIVEGVGDEHTPAAKQTPSRNYIDSSRRSLASSSIRPSNSARDAHASSPSIGSTTKLAMKSQSTSSRVSKSSMNSLPRDAVPLGRVHQPQRPRPSAPLLSTKKATHHSMKSNNAVMTASPSRSAVRVANSTEISAKTTSLASLHNIKQYKSMPPLWQQLDDEFEERMLVQKRDRSGNMVGFTMRAAAARREATTSWGSGKDGRKTARMGAGGGAGGGGDSDRALDLGDPNYINGHIAPRLRLTVGDDVVVDELSDDEPEDREDENIYDGDHEEQQIYMPVAKKISVNDAMRPMPPIRMSSARKIRSVVASSSEESESESESEADSEHLVPVPVEEADSEKGTDDEEEDELDPDQYDPEPRRDMDGDVVMRTGSVEVEILPFDEDKMITAPLPPPIKREDNHEPRLRDDGDKSDDGYTPSEALISAIEALSLSASRMRATRQLPFLRRNVRQGFLERCRWLYVPIYSEFQDDDNPGSRNKMRMQVVYETAGSGMYRADVDEWICPICDLFHQGEEEDEKGFETREMLDCHLSWHHSEIYYEWVPSQALGLEQTRNDSQDENIGYEWQLQLVIPEPEPDLQGPPQRIDTPTRQTGTPVGEKESTASTPRRSVTQVRFNEDSGIFPYVSLSPPSARLPSTPNSSQTAQSQPTKTDTRFIAKKVASTRVSTTSVKPKGRNEVVNIGKHEEVESSLTHELEDDDDSVAAIHKLDKGKSVSRDLLSPSTSGSISTSLSGPNTSNTASRSRSLTERTSDTSTGPSMTRETQPRARSPTSRYPTPPPADAPLGPAARYPYLPASPSHLGDGGGPAIDERIAAVPNHITGTTISYSCRPGPGPYLFDILDTLPLAQYGVLSWEVLDREDEIWESDTVKEEYKVMQALWARWIFLPANRNKFIADYLKGTKAFIDTYWRVIHKAAGWSALRFFLFILLANNFLSGHDVAQVLLYYQNLTGMENWTT